MKFGVSVPANILLMGEYAVLEERGLGIGLAPDIRATGSAEPSEQVSICGAFGRQSFTWPGDSGVLGRAAEHLAARHPLGSTRAAININTTPFYGSDGSKLGLGSSAAATVVLAALWLRLCSDRRTQEAPSLDSVFAEAVAAHRAGQDGRGSGYDVAASVFGGVTRFSGGPNPRAERLSLPWFPQFRLVAGLAVVRTGSAVASYYNWKSRYPEDAAGFLARSNRLVDQFCTAASWAGAASILEEYRELAVGLGDQIGVPARFESPRQGSFLKAVGAGNELGILLGAGQTDPDDLSAALETGAGITWE